MNQHVLTGEMSFSNQYVFMGLTIMVNGKCDIEDMLLTLHFIYKVTCCNLKNYDSYNACFYYYFFNKHSYIN